MVVGLPPLILWLSIGLSKKWGDFGPLRRRTFYGTSLFLVLLIPIGLHGAVWWAKSHNEDFHPDEFESLRSIAPKIESLCQGQPIFFYRDFENLSSLSFYLKRPVPILDSVSKDLWYAQKHGGYAEFFPGFKSLKSLSSACVVVRKGQVHNFKKQSSSLGLEIKILWEPYALNFKGSRKVPVLFHIASPYAKLRSN